MCFKKLKYSAFAAISRRGYLSFLSAFASRLLSDVASTTASQRFATSAEGDQEQAAFLAVYQWKHFPVDGTAAKKPIVICRLESYTWDAESIEKHARHV